MGDILNNFNIDEDIRGDCGVYSPANNEIRFELCDGDSEYYAVCQSLDNIPSDFDYEGKSERNKSCGIQVTH